MVHDCLPHANLVGRFQWMQSAGRAGVGAGEVVANHAGLLTGHDVGMARLGRWGWPAPFGRASVHLDALGGACHKTGTAASAKVSELRFRGSSGWSEISVVPDRVVIAGPGRTRQNLSRRRVNLINAAGQNLPKKGSATNRIGMGG